MGMEEVLDSVRRIVHKWANTISPITQTVNKNDTTIHVQNVRRFSVGDQIMLKNNQVFETGLVISKIDFYNNIITVSNPIMNTWAKDSNPVINPVIIKTLDEQFVQGIYIGDPEVIPRYPAITVNGTSRASEWLTIRSTKERYEIEIGVLFKIRLMKKDIDFLCN